MPARTQIVDRLSENLFTDAGFPEQKNRRRHRGDPFCLLKRMTHGARFGDDPVKT
jgi:hypothetical protein